RGRPFTWLVTLARSRAIDRLRQLGSRQRLASSAIEFAGEGISDAAENTFRSEQRQLVAAALTELSEEQRRTLTLAYFEGLTQAEIAERLRSPLGTVKTRMRSGMIKLRELLSQKMESRAF
ncbi:MAG TPA: sigma-70 family RNA polymerase sigma factor, partial [Pyrinomonadaceae bacterium]